MQSMNRVNIAREVVVDVASTYMYVICSLGGISMVYTVCVHYHSIADSQRIK